MIVMFKDKIVIPFFIGMLIVRVLTVNIHIWAKPPREKIPCMSEVE